MGLSEVGGLFGGEGDGGDDVAAEGLFEGFFDVVGYGFALGYGERGGNFYS